MIEIDGPRALALLTEAVNDKGTDYVCRLCEYERDNQPACLVGYALYRAGVSADTLVSMDLPNDGCGDYEGDSAIASLSTISPEYFGFQLDELAVVAFSTAQNRQDNGRTWGEALEEAARSVAACTP